MCERYKQNIYLYFFIHCVANLTKYAPECIFVKKKTHIHSLHSIQVVSSESSFSCKSPVKSQIPLYNYHKKTWVDADSLY